MRLLSILIIIIIQSFSFSQDDSIRYNKLIISPSVHSIDINATSIILINQIGGQFDFDVFRSFNKRLCVGTRMSVEHYYINNFVEKLNGSPFTNYNLYSRLTSTNEKLSISVLGGVSYYTADDPNSIPEKYLFRAGFEVKLGSVIGLVLKGSTSLVKNSSFLGIGVYMGYDHIK